MSKRLSLLKTRLLRNNGTEVTVGTDTVAIMDAVVAARLLKRLPYQKIRKVLSNTGAILPTAIIPTVTAVGAEVTEEDTGVVAGQLTSLKNKQPTNKPTSSDIMVDITMVTDAEDITVATAAIIGDLLKTEFSLRCPVNDYSVLAFAQHFGFFHENNTSIQ